MGDTLLLYHDVFTNGIGYLRFMFDLRQVPEELFPYVGVLKTVASAFSFRLVSPFTGFTTTTLLCGFPIRHSLIISS